MPVFPTMISRDLKKSLKTDKIDHFLLKKQTKNRPFFLKISRKTDLHHSFIPTNMVMQIRARGESWGGATRAGGMMQQILLLS